MPKAIQRQRSDRGAGRRAAPSAAVSLTGSGGPEPGDAGSALERLARLLDTPQLIRAVPYLPAGTLHQLVRHQGVENCGALLAAATPAQLRSVLDLDLWRSAEAGLDEQFDRVRFGEWVEGLVEAGDATAAGIAARIDSQLMIAGLAGHVRVFDAAVVAWLEADDPVDQPTRFAGLTCTVGGYVMRARRADAWNAIVALLVALEADHGDYFHAVMRGCRRLSNSRPEVDGLDSLLADGDQLLHDVGDQRQHRRTQQGFLPPAEARAFLQMARQRTHGPHPPQAPNPIAAAYLGPADEAVPPGAGDAAPAQNDAEPAADPEVREALDTVAVLLAEAVRAPGQARALVAGPVVPGSRRTHVRALVEHVRVADERAFLARGRELAFLANTLMAGCSVWARPFTAQEASDAALATCDLGLDYWPERWPDDGDQPRAVAGAAMLPEDFLSDHDLLTAFQVGWAALHETSLFVAERLVEVLRTVPRADSETQRGLVALRRELVRHCKAGTPWGARDALDVLAGVDTPAWTALLGALDECPVVPEVLTAILERRTGAVSATAFSFVSSTDQVADIRAFARKLADVLQ